MSLWLYLALDLLLGVLLARGASIESLPWPVVMVFAGVFENALVYAAFLFQSTNVHAFVN